MQFLKPGRVVVIGAGVVGLATASRLAAEGYEVIILERGGQIAEGVTSRNSGVIHSPINYKPGSLKAIFCTRGRDLLYAWCESHRVPYRQTGKLIVAVDVREEAELQRIQQNAIENEASEVELLSTSELRKLEPNVSGFAALHAPKSGIVDPIALSRSFLLDAQRNGATLITLANVSEVQQEANLFVFRTPNGPIKGTYVINSAGLYADEVAALAGAATYRVFSWRGDYFTFTPGEGRTFERLIYPVKVKSRPGLGIHLTFDMQGRLRLGPDAERVMSKDDFSPKEGKLEKFLIAAKKLFPWATADMLRYDTAGIRPKLRGPAESEEKDFIVRQDLPGWINLIGIESPGLTACMAIAKEVQRLIALSNR